MRSALEDAARAAGFHPRPAFEGSDTETVRGLVSAGLGVALLPAATHPLGPDVVELAVRAPSTTRTIVLVAIAGRTLPPPAAALRATVRERGL